ncbi:sugar transferase [Microbacterium sp.]|uniref:sugar transferase n=1 Tax=Microbacterium sp. TaxID=51671 RepID=UPI003A88C411
MLENAVEHPAATVRLVADGGVKRAEKRLRRAATVVRQRRSSRDWPARYAARLVYSDVVVVVAVLLVFAAVALPSLRSHIAWSGGARVPYWAVLVVIGLAWLLALSVLETRDKHIVGDGVLEYRRIVSATALVFAVFVALAFFLRADISRALFLVALPLGAVALVLSRWLWRQWLGAQQRREKYVYRAVVVAEPAKAEHIIEAIRRAGRTGFDIVGVVSSGRLPAHIDGIPVVGGYGNAVQAMDAVDADTVILVGADDLDPAAVRRLGWEVADRDANLVVAPALTDVAGPRIHSRPVAGLPLIHVEYPTLEGGKRFAKRTFDLVGAAVLTVVLSPIMLLTAIAIRLDSRGAVFYRQERIGRRGRPFRMSKFRSMAEGADAQLASLLDDQGTAEQPLFKVADDPRITRVGRFIRKYSIDELPQLFNVLAGTMSLVGPRPQRKAEVALYDDDAHRRLLVKPGMSGLWQVSGRSELSWEDALRLDLYYVENWSFTQDIQILFRTFRAVIAPGASAH